jgi:hypothetical protein
VTRSEGRFVTFHPVLPRREGPCCKLDPRGLASDQNRDFIPTAARIFTLRLAGRAFASETDVFRPGDQRSGLSPASEDFGSEAFKTSGYMPIQAAMPPSEKGTRPGLKPAGLTGFSEGASKDAAGVFPSEVTVL